MDIEPLYKLYQHPLLSKEDCERIIEYHNRLNFKKGEFLLEVGLMADAYYIVESGLVRSFVHDYDNNDITTGFFTNNTLVIDASSLFQRIPAQENIQALTDVVCWKIDFEDFQRLFHSIEGFREWGRAWMAESLFELKKRSVSMITDSATTRYLHLLRHQPDILKNAPLKHIASYLGITDSTLSRIRKETAQS